jgi:DNA-binding transcriptional LysR family regulator
MISKTNQIELRQLRYFKALAEELHYRLAAEKLHISQSALSQQIKLLETQLDFPLFDRFNKRITLSEWGLQLYTEATKIITQVDRSMNTLFLLREGVQGELSIGFVASAMSSFLPNTIRHFYKSFPSIRLRLEEMNNLEQLAALDKGDLDIGFMRSNQISEHMEIRPVLEETFTLILPKGHPQSGPNFSGLMGLSDEDFILFPNAKSEFYFQQIISLCSSAGFFPKITHQAIHGPTVFALVACGMGVSIVPTSLAKSATAEVELIELKDIPQRTQLFAVWKRNQNHLQISRFLNTIAQH